MKKIKVKKVYFVIVFVIVALIGGIGYKTYQKNNQWKKNIKFKEVSFNKEVNTSSSLIPAVYIFNKSGEKYESIKKYFYSVGFDIMEGSMEDYFNLNKENSVLLVPEKEGNSLNDKEIELILKGLQSGKNIIFNGDTKLNEKLGIKSLGKKTNINTYVWESHKDVKIELKDNNEFKKFKYEGKDTKILATYKDSPLVIKGSYGSGNFIYSGMELWKYKGEGYEISPYVMETVVEEFKVKPQIYRNDLTAYVNINYFLNEKPEVITNRAMNAGISQLNISGWTSDNKEYTKNLIDECHKKGITAYLWAEFPMVTIDFWNKHPEWREKTASGEDAQIDWRYLMALEDPECFKAVEKYLLDVLREFDWDGVDIAEIYFEAPDKGINKPSTFTPMHDSFRKDFKDKYGVDPKNVVQSKFGFLSPKNADMKEKIIAERVELVTELNEKILQVCESAKKEKPYIKTMVTVIDSLIDKRMEKNIGVSAKKLIDLQNKYDFTLQIEDPYTLWVYGPQRYQIIGETYKELMEKGKKLAIDINFVDRYGKVYPTKKQRGAEIIELLYNAYGSAERVTFYAVETMVDSDMKLVPFVRRNDIKIKDVGEGKYEFKSDKKFSIALNTKEKQYFLDGKPWPFVGENQVVLPKGNHVLEEKSGKEVKKCINSISGEIISGEVTNNGVNFEYESENRCYIILEEIPNKVVLDGKEFNLSNLDKQNKLLILSEGKHKVNLIYK